MSLSNTSESDALDIFLEGSDPAWRDGATIDGAGTELDPWGPA